MGQRTVYYKPTHGKSLKESFETDYGQFRDWIIATNEESLKEYNERLISVEAELLIKANPTTHVEEWSQPTIDRMIFEYLLTYCDYGPGQGRYEIVGPMMNTWRYEKTNRLIEKVADKELTTIWGYLTHGRSIKNNRPFISNDGENIIGFWDLGNRDFLSHRLVKLNNAPSDNEGIEYALSVIAEMKNDKSDLILNLERHAPSVE